MPPLSCWFIRTALIHLALGLTFGALMLTYKAFPWHPLMWWLLPAHVEFLLMGWVMQLVMGMGFWMWPRFEGGASRGNVAAAWAAFFLLNGGVWAAALGGVWEAATGQAHWLTPGGRTLEVAAALAFALHAWPRVKPPPVSP